MELVSTSIFILVLSLFERIRRTHEYCPLRMLTRLWPTFAFLFLISTYVRQPQTLCNCGKIRIKIEIVIGR
jgi:hypothetical protein